MWICIAPRREHTCKVLNYDRFSCWVKTADSCPIIIVNILVLNIWFALLQLMECVGLSVLKSYISYCQWRPLLTCNSGMCVRVCVHVCVRACMCVCVCDKRRNANMKPFGGVDLAPQPAPATSKVWLIGLLMKLIIDYCWSNSFCIQ